MKPAAAASAAGAAAAPHLAPLQYYGRQVPIVCRVFPPIKVYPITARRVQDEAVAPSAGVQQKCRFSNWFPSFPPLWRRQKMRAPTIPADLPGRLNLLLLAFGKRQMPRELFSYYPLGRILHTEMSRRYAAVNLSNVDMLGVTTVIALPRWMRPLHPWVTWRCRSLIRAYASRKVRRREHDKLRRLARGAGVPDADRAIKFGLRGPVLLKKGSTDEGGSELDDEDLAAVNALRQRNFENFRRARADAPAAAAFAGELEKNTYVAYIHRHRFTDTLKIPDFTRCYAAIVNAAGVIYWFEDGPCTIHKANTAFDQLKLDYLKIDRKLLRSARINPNVTLYGRGPEFVGERPPPLPLAAAKAERIGGATPPLPLEASARCSQLEGEVAAPAAVTSPVPSSGDETHTAQVNAMEHPPGEAAAEVIYEDVPIGRFEIDGGVMYYPCPCGDLFELSLADLKGGMRIATCPSCSLRVKVIATDAEIAATIAGTAA